MPGKQEEPVSALESFKHLFNKPRVRDAKPFFKTPPVKSKKNLVEARSRSCENCGQKPGDPNNPVDPHHIKTRGSGGGDERQNLASLCRKCHTGAHDGKVEKEKLKAIAKARK